MKIIFAGAGALGSQIAIAVASPTIEIILIDDDVVGNENIGTSIYTRCQVGMPKAVALAEMLYLKCGVNAMPRVETVEACLAVPDNDYLIIDTFDNPQARGFTCGLNTLHAGVSIDRTGGVAWDEMYTVPEIAFERGNNLICTNQLGKKILRLTAAMAANCIDVYLDTGNRKNVLVTEFSVVTWG